MQSILVMHRSIHRCWCSVESSKGQSMDPWSTHIRKEKLLFRTGFKYLNYHLSWNTLPKQSFSKATLVENYRKCLHIIFMPKITLFPKLSHNNQNKCRLWLVDWWYFPPIIVLLKLTCLVTLIDCKFKVFNNSSKLKIFDIFNQLLSARKVNIARFTRDVEWDFLCNFQTPCLWCFQLALLQHICQLFYMNRVCQRKYGLASAAPFVDNPTQILFSFSHFQVSDAYLCMVVVVGTENRRKSVTKFMQKKSLKSL